MAWGDESGTIVLRPYKDELSLGAPRDRLASDDGSLFSLVLPTAR